MNNSSDNSDKAIKNIQIKDLILKKVLQIDLGQVNWECDDIDEEDSLSTFIECSAYISSANAKGGENFSIIEYRSNRNSSKIEPQIFSNFPPSAKDILQSIIENKSIFDIFKPLSNECIVRLILSAINKDLSLENGEYLKGEVTFKTVNDYLHNVGFDEYIPCVFSCTKTYKNTKGIIYPEMIGAGYLSDLEKEKNSNNINIFHGVDSNEESFLSNKEEQKIEKINITLRSEPAGKIMLGELTEEQTIILNDCKSKRDGESVKDLLRLKKESLWLKETEGIFSVGEQGEKGLEGIIELEEGRIEIPLSQNNEDNFEYKNGIYFLNVSLSAITWNLSFDSPDGIAYNQNEFIEVSLPVDLPECFAEGHILYSDKISGRFNVIKGFKYKGEALKNFEDYQLDGGYYDLLIIVSYKDDETTVLYSNYMGDEYWNLSKEELLEQRKNEISLKHDLEIQKEKDNNIKKAKHKYFSEARNNAPKEGPESLKYWEEINKKWTEIKSSL